MAKADETTETMVLTSRRSGCSRWLGTAAAVFALSLSELVAQAPAAPSALPQARQQEPTAPSPQGPITEGAAPANSFPPVNLKNFTAASPTREEVNSFLKAIWGYDANRTWSVAAILKTSAPGVAKVVVLVADKSKPGKGTQTVFFTTPDGKHAIAGEVIDFGAKPFEEARQTLEARADGPAEGAASKDLLLVEFTDLQCPQCKTAQNTLNNLAKEIPQARIVLEDLPVPELYPYSERTAAEGDCVRQAKGDAAYFKYAQAVFDKQDQLTAAGVDATLAAAVTTAGADPKSVGTCAATPEIRAKVAAAKTLATDLGVDRIPVLAVNGHMLPMATLPYDTLKQIIAFQASQDGITVHVQPTLSTLQ
jgi:protein-disulfide isomerase